MADNPGIFGGLHCVDVLDLIWVSDSWVASPKEGGGGGRINGIKSLAICEEKINYLFSKSCG